MTGTRRLGRGLEALLGPISREAAQASGALTELEVRAIRPNPYQPRQDLDPKAFDELVSSLETSGLLQPIVVRADQGSWQLIAGERRWRAAQKLGWQRIPAVVKEVDDRTLLTLALVENLQRDQLTALEEAISYRRLIEEFGVSQVEVANLVGKSRPAVANALRLLKLPAEIRTMIQEGRLSEGHGRALLALPDERAMVRVARDAVAAGWSVREVEERSRGGNSRVRPSGKQPKPQSGPVSSAARRIEDVLRQRLGTDVRMTAKRKGRGQIAISYYTNDDLARLLEIILGEPYDG
ncbi:MAG: ParB/RepB/Spo0J family partition protein [Gemmatimonadales bacterium]